MSDAGRSVAESLGAEERLLPFVPALLQDLWALGVAPAAMLGLLERCGLALRRNLRVLDLGCGKGAALIRMAQRFGWGGEGVDLVPEFVEEARRRASEAGVGERVRFDLADLRQAAGAGEPVDLILFGFDSDLLGSLQQALAVVRSRLAPGGHLVLDTAWTRAREPRPELAPSEDDTRRAIAAAGLDVVGEQRLDAEWLRAQNDGNTKHIRRRAEELGRLHPDKRPWFDDYVRRQEQECLQLEQQLECAILLLAPRS